jgi:hypothetical protein
MTRARTRNFVLATAALFALIQMIPAPRVNPAVSQNVPAPPAASAVLERACYDCHSSSTRWPWYVHVAPVSWFLIRDVNRGRRHLNFSAWDKYEGDPGTAIHKLEEIRKETAAGAMPPWYYVAMHPGARLDRADRDALARWIGGEIARERKLEDSLQ